MPYRFALLGCGHVSGRHAEAILKAGILAGVCDSIKDRAETTGARYGVPAFIDSGKMISAICPDVVVICTPNGLHFTQVCTALEAGCHVLCEKPLAISALDGKKMVQTAERMRRSLQVVKQNRFLPATLLLKSLLEEDRLGKITEFQLNCLWNRPDYYYDSPWKGTLELDGGALYTQFSHFIDLLYWYLGEPEQVRGWRFNHQHINSIEFEDSGMIHLLMESGVSGNLSYSLNAYRSNMEGSFTLLGERGTIKIGGAYLNHLSHFEVEGMTREAAENKMELWRQRHPLDRVYEELIRSIEQESHASVGAAEALKSIEIIDMIYRNAPLLSTGKHRP